VLSFLKLRFEINVKDLFGLDLKTCIIQLNL
jgi:hypothetical protein